MKSRSDPQALANLLVGQERDIALLVGSGVSAAASSGASAATWPGLLASGIEFCEENLPGLPDSFSLGLRTLLESPDVETLVTVAEGISSKLQASGDILFSRWLGETVGSLEVRDTRLLEVLRQLDLPVATTNYDDLLAGLAQQPPVGWRDIRKVSEVLNRKRQAIIHLHGHWDEPSDVIFGGRSYGTLIGDVEAEALFRSFFYTHALVAIGMGEGMLDPNFAQLREWLQSVAPNAPYYTLVRADDFQAAQRLAPFQPIVYGDRFEDLPDFLGQLAQYLDVEAASGPAFTSGPVLPPRAEPIGRNVEMEELLDFLGSGADRAVSLAVTGPAGIGKTFLVSAVMHRPPVVRRYGSRRYFLSCSAVSSGAALLSQVARVCGLAEDVSRWSAYGDPGLRTELALAQIKKPALLVLDNLEDAFSRSRVAVLGAIRLLSRFFDVIVTMRDASDDLPDWMEELPLGPLSVESLRELVKLWGTERTAADSVVRKAALEGTLTPLDLWLTAQAFDPRSEKKGYQLEGDQNGIGELEERLLGVLVHAADGLPRECVFTLLGGKAPAAASALERRGVAHLGEETLLLVASARPRLASFATSRRDDISDAIASLTEAYDPRSLMVTFPGSLDGLLAALIVASDDKQLGEAVEWLLGTEDAQMATGIRLSTAWSTALEAAEGSEDTELSSKVLLGAGRLAVLDGNIGVARRRIDAALERAEAGMPVEARVAIGLEAARAARLDDDPRHAAETIDGMVALSTSLPEQTLGEIELERAFQALHVDDPVSARRRLDAAGRIFETVGFETGLARVGETLGEALRQQGLYEESERQLTRALAAAEQVEDVHVLAHCLFSLGVTARYRGAIEEAADYQNRAMKAYEEESNRLGLANAHKELGILCGLRDAFGPGRAHFSRAVDNYRHAGSAFGLANCFLGEAELELAADRPEQARDRAENAVDLYRTIDHPRAAKAQELLTALS